MQKLLFQARLLVLILTLWTSAGALPATPLEEVVKAYNRLRDQEDDTPLGEMSLSNLAAMQAEYAGICASLEQLCQSQQLDLARTARYLRANFLYELGLVAHHIQHDQEAYSSWSSAASDMVFLTEVKNFPLTYPFAGRLQRVEFEDFSPTLVGFYSQMGALCLQLQRYQEAITWLSRVKQLSGSTLWLRYLAASGILTAKRELREMDDKLPQQSLEQILLATRLPPEQLQLILSQKYPSAQLGYSTLKWALQFRPEWDAGHNYYAQAARALSQLGYKLAAEEAQKLAQGKK